MLALAALPFLLFAKHADADEVRDEPRDPRPIVVLDTDQSVRLEARVDDEWQTVCVTPCKVHVPIGTELRVDGDGIRASRPFLLSARPGERVAYAVDPRSPDGLVAGISLIALGPVMTMTGFALAIDSFGLDSCANCKSVGKQTEGDVGSALMLGGLVATGVGIPVGILLIRADHTRVVPVTAEPTEAPLMPRTPALLRGLERPAPEHRYEGARATTFPIVSLSF